MLRHLQGQEDLFLPCNHGSGRYRVETSSPHLEEEEKEEEEEEEEEKADEEV